MPGDYGQKFASYRAFLAYMMAHPGKKLLFMGQEFGQEKEWDYQGQLDWGLLELDSHSKLLHFSEKLNKFYAENTPLWQNDDSWGGFSWISNDDYKQSVIAFRRIDDNGDEIITICNFVPVERRDYRIGVPKKGTYKVVFNTDATEFGGADLSAKSYKSEEIPMHTFDDSISLTLAPLSVMYLKLTPARKKAEKTETSAAAKKTSKSKTSTTAKKTAAKSETAEKKAEKAPAKKSAAKAEKTEKPAASAAKKTAAKTETSARKKTVKSEAEDAVTAKTKKTPGRRKKSSDGDK
jgi:1,4-alpha-glucan branching enzyme